MLTTPKSDWKSNEATGQRAKLALGAGSKVESRSRSRKFLGVDSGAVGFGGGFGRDLCVAGMNFYEACGFKLGEIFQLAAIPYPKAPGIVCESFINPSDALSWAEEWRGKRNLYVCGNPLKKKLSKKASDKDVAEVRVLLVDADPPGDTLAFLQSVAEKLGGFVLDSGRGHQLWTRHSAEVIPFRAKILAELRKTATVTIDGTHDPSRLMRLPGFPNLKTGRISQWVT